MSRKEPILSLRGVEMTYRIRKQVFSRQKKQVRALKDISFDIYRGEKLGIIGRNGCGKSTLFKILAGIFEPDRGEFTFRPGLNVQLLSLGVGFEGNLTGRENAILNGMLLGKTRDYMKRRAEAIREFSELGEFFDMPVFTYSSGMNARLGFSVALEANPDVLLIDEVLGVGDAHFAEKSEKAMMERFDSQATIVLVTHNHQMIRKLCDRAVWIEDGETRMEGATDAVSKAYLDSLELEGQPGSDAPLPPSSDPGWSGNAAGALPGAPPAGAAPEAAVRGFDGWDAIRIGCRFMQEWAAVNVWDSRRADWLFPEHRVVYDLSEITVRGLEPGGWFGVSAWRFEDSRWHGVFAFLSGESGTRREEPLLVTQTAGEGAGTGMDASARVTLATEGNEREGWFSARLWSAGRGDWLPGEETVFEPETVGFSLANASVWHWAGLWSFERSGWSVGSWVGIFPYETGR